MAKKPSTPAALPPDDATDTTSDEASPERVGPQGITIRYMNTGNPKRDFHARHRGVRMIDPASLVVDGLDPVLALPVQDSPRKVHKRVLAIDAAEMLSCDRMTGGQSVYRLSTDAEVEEMLARDAARVKKHEAAVAAKTKK